MLNSATRNELGRAEVLSLLAIASRMDDAAIGDLLTNFCELMKGRVRFASLWKYNKCYDSISISARSNGDYFPQLGPNGENIQEFVCRADCPAVRNILGLDVDGEVASKSAFMRRKSATFSILRSGIYGIFHPEEIVRRIELDEFVMLPIDTRHAPGQNGSGGESSYAEIPVKEPPRYFCLFYCPIGQTADSLHDDDLALIQRCLGNMIFNTFSRRRHEIIEKLTLHLAEILDDDSSLLLDHLASESLPCRAVFKITVDSLQEKRLKIECGPNNLSNLGHDGARRIWDSVSREQGSIALLPKDLLLSSMPKIGSALLWQRIGETERERAMYLFCDKVSRCPLQGAKEPVGQETFNNIFGFDDIKLIEEIGAHIRAFTETKEAKTRRSNNARIVSHESSSPFYDIRNILSKNRDYPSLMPWNEAADLIDNAARLGLAMVGMNKELTDEKLRKLSISSDVTTFIAPFLVKLKRTLIGVCKDVRFINDNVDVSVDTSCRSLAINTDILQTIFINTVTNSIKYADRNVSSDRRWCNFRLIRVYSRDDQSWIGLGKPANYRRSGLLMTTTDNGIGIKDAEKHLVFEQEWQSSNRDVAKGLGLGLWHVKRIVDALDGDIWVQSGSDLNHEHDARTRVCVLLPFRF